MLVHIWQACSSEYDGSLSLCHSELSILCFSVLCFILGVGGGCVPWYCSLALAYCGSSR
jgi:hypothetical protein